MSLNDKAIEEYAQLVQKMKARNENARNKSMHHQIDLDETFQPAIQATKEQTAQLKASSESAKKSLLRKYGTETMLWIFISTITQKRN